MRSSYVHWANLKLFSYYTYKEDPRIRSIKERNEKKKKEIT